MPSPGLAVNLIGLTVPDVHAAIDWYGDVFGFRCIMGPAYWTQPATARQRRYSAAGSAGHGKHICSRRTRSGWSCPNSSTRQRNRCSRPVWAAHADAQLTSVTRSEISTPRRLPPLASLAWAAHAHSLPASAAWRGFPTHTGCPAQVPNPHRPPGAGHRPTPAARRKSPTHTGRLAQVTDPHRLPTHLPDPHRPPSAGPQPHRLPGACPRPTPVTETDPPASRADAGPHPHQQPTRPAVDRAPNPPTRTTHAVPCRPDRDTLTPGQPGPAVTGGSTEIVQRGDRSA